MHPARKAATYEDLLALPAHVTGEIVRGVLHSMPRPRTRHARTALVLSGGLGGPFDYGSGGPGGWLFLVEPELHLGQDIVVPDIAGWKRTRLPAIPDEPFLTIAPSWVCEILSPTTEVFDRADKMPVYAEHGVAHAWLVDPDSRMLEVFRLDGETWRVLRTFRGEAPVRAEPFDAIELDLRALWI